MHWHAPYLAVEDSGVIDDEALVVLASAVKAGCLSVVDLTRWADEQILDQDRPPGWLIDLSQTSSPETAANLLWAGWQEQFEAAGRRSRLRERSGELDLGFLFLPRRIRRRRSLRGPALN